MRVRLWPAPSTLCHLTLVLFSGQSSTVNPEKGGRMINRRTRSHLSCQGSCHITELPGIVVRVQTLNISCQSAAYRRIFSFASMPSVRLNLDELAQPGELGVAINLAMLYKSKSLDDR